MRKLLLLVPLLFACYTTDPRTRVAMTLDDWHDAAADADEARYFAAMAPEFGRHRSAGDLLGLLLPKAAQDL